MNKILAGLLFGLVLGAIDGATAWFYPETHSAIGGILVGSSIKGMLVGPLSGGVARRGETTKRGGGFAGAVRFGGGCELKGLRVACLGGGSARRVKSRKGGFFLGGALGLSRPTSMP